MTENRDRLTRLAVPRRTGTAGDDLIAWGLARVISAAIGENVVLRDGGSRLLVEVPLPRDELDAALGEPESLDAARLRWLESSEKGKKAPNGVPSVDRDLLREAQRVVREAARSSGLPAELAQSAGPSITTRGDASRYPLYQVLTNPGTQWSGYNRLVESTTTLVEPAGLRLLIERFQERTPLLDGELDDRLKRAGVKGRGDRWRNPPGFLFSGLNKGPTLPLALSDAVAVGNPSRTDPEMVDRGDLDLVALYLAYVGYFAVARVLEWDDGRTVVVPAPFRILVPRGLGVVQRVELRGSSNQDLLAARAALAYARSVMGYLSDLRSLDSFEAEREGTVLHGLSLVQFWKPSNNAYAPIRTGLVPLPVWLPALYQQDWEVVSAALDLHQAALRSLKGAVADKRLSAEQREAMAAYRLSLDAGPHEWFRAVSAWFPALRESARPDAKFAPRPWGDVDVRSIAVALSPALSEVLDHPAFGGVAGAIRAATLHPHEDMRRFREKKGPKPLYDAEYDLVSTLMSAADRSTAEFVAELCRFVARYNDATIRPKTTGEPGTPFHRALVKDEDLRQVIRWLGDDRTGAIAAAILAFGTSRHGSSSKLGQSNPPLAAEALEEGEDSMVEDDTSSSSQEVNA